jgi:hypothetical protein
MRNSYRVDRHVYCCSCSQAARLDPSCPGLALYSTRQICHTPLGEGSGKARDLLERSTTFVGRKRLLQEV